VELAWRSAFTGDALTAQCETLRARSGRVNAAAALRGSRLGAAAIRARLRGYSDAAVTARNTPDRRP
jgi:uncharacterized membrane protein